MPIIVANINYRKHLFHNEMYPPLSLYFNDRLEFGEFFLMKYQKDKQPIGNIYCPGDLDEILIQVHLNKLECRGKVHLFQ